MAAGTPAVPGTALAGRGAASGRSEEDFEIILKDPGVDASIFAEALDDFSDEKLGQAISENPRTFEMLRVACRFGAMTSEGYAALKNVMDRFARMPRPPSAEPPVPGTALAGRGAASGRSEEDFEIILKDPGADASIFAEVLDGFSDEKLGQAISENPRTFEMLRVACRFGAMTSKGYAALKNVMDRFAGMPLSVVQFADALGCKIVNCGGSGNNCMLLSALTARDRLAGKSPPTGGYAAEAERLRQKILSAIHADLQNRVSRLERCLTTIGLPAEEIATIVEKAKSLSERGVNPKLDEEGTAGLRAQLLPKIASWLGVAEGSDDAYSEYGRLSGIMDEVGIVSLLHKRSGAGRPLRIEVAKYLALALRRTVAIVDENSDAPSNGYYVYCFRGDELSTGTLQGSLVRSRSEEWKAQYGSGMSDRPIILELSGNDRFRHYRAFVPKGNA
jgi:hypothetical protein